MSTDNQKVEVFNSIKALLISARSHEQQGWNSIQLPLDLYIPLLESFKENMLDLMGAEVALEFFKQTLDKHGIEIQVS